LRPILHSIRWVDAHAQAIQLMHGDWTYKPSHNPKYLRDHPPQNSQKQMPYLETTEKEMEINKVNIYS
jgi:hypothetical protein